MKKYIGRRVLQLIPVLLGITLLSFFLLHTSSVTAVDMKEANTGGVLSEAERTAMEAELGLDQPLWKQYGTWLVQVLHGDFGTSYVSGKPVGSTILSKLPATLELTVCSLLLTILLSFPLGVAAAVKKDSWLDRAIRFFSFIGNSLPNFFVALLLLYVFAVKLQWLPVLGSSQGWKGILLPSLTLAIAMAAKYTRQIRAAVLEELQKEYVTGARARGITEKKILYKSVLRSAMLAIVTLLGLSIGSLLGGPAIVETIFSWDGVGKMAIDAITMRDYPVMQAYVIWMALIYMVINLGTDLLYHGLDPRIRLGGEK